MLQDGAADVAVFVWSVERSMVVDFTVPIHPFVSTLLAPARPAGPSRMWAYLTIFDEHVLAAALAAYVATAACMALVYRYKAAGHDERLDDEDDLVPSNTVAGATFSLMVSLVLSDGYSYRQKVKIR